MKLENFRDENEQQATSPSHAHSIVFPSLSWLEKILQGTTIRQCRIHPVLLSHSYQILTTWGPKKQTRQIAENGKWDYYICNRTLKGETQKSIHAIYFQSSRLVVGLLKPSFRSRLLHLAPTAALTFNPPPLPHRGLNLSRIRCWRRELVIQDAS